LESIETETQTDAPVTVEKVFQTEEVLHSSEQDATIRILEAALEQSQQTLTQWRNEMVTITEHKKKFKQLRAMSATENETFIDISREKEKTKKSQG
jgi:hypothetical protein